MCSDVDPLCTQQLCYWFLAAVQEKKAQLINLSINASVIEIESFNR